MGERGTDVSTNVFFEAMNEVSDRYYEEAANYQAPKRWWVKWVVMAAYSLCGSFLCCEILPSARDRGAEHSDGIVVDEPTPTVPGGYIRTRDIHFNEW